MTDLEIIRLCAEAMGYKGEGLSTHWGGLPMFASEIGPFDPLHDDAQAMALVKKFVLDSTWLMPFDEGAKGRWRVVGTIAGWDRTENADLNRAICECVAKMMREKVTT